MAYELVVKQPFAAHDRQTGERQNFARGDIIDDPAIVAKIEASPWAAHVMRRAARAVPLAVAAATPEAEA